MHQESVTSLSPPQQELLFSVSTALRQRRGESDSRKRKQEKVAVSLSNTIAPKMAIVLRNQKRFLKPSTVKWSRTITQKTYPCADDIAGSGGVPQQKPAVVTEARRGTQMSGIDTETTDGLESVVEVGVGGGVIDPQRRGRLMGQDSIVGLKADDQGQTERGFGTIA